MSERNDSNPFTQNLPLPRPERRRRAREIRKKLQTMDERQVLVKEGLSSLAYQTGLASLTRLMEQDVDRVCGVKGVSAQSVWPSIAHSLWPRTNRNFVIFDSIRKHPAHQFACVAAWRPGCGCWNRRWACG